MMSTIYKGSVDEKVALAFGVYDLHSSRSGEEITRDEMLKVFQAAISSSSAPSVPTSTPNKAAAGVFSPEERVKTVFREMDRKHEEDAIWDPEIGMSEFKLDSDSKSETKA